MKTFCALLFTLAVQTTALKLNKPNVVKNPVVKSLVNQHEVDEAVKALKLMANNQKKSAKGDAEYYYELLAFETQTSGCERGETAIDSQRCTDIIPCMCKGAPQGGIPRHEGKDVNPAEGCADQWTKACGLVYDAISKQTKQDWHYCIPTIMCPGETVLQTNKKLALADKAVIEEKPTYNIMHIPKTGGDTYGNLMAQLVPLSGNRESPYCKMSEKANSRVLTFLREPTRHVLSQYGHCTTADVHQGGWGEMPKTFGEFASAWHQQNISFPETASASKFCCYNPTNMQTRFASCQPKIGNLAVALDNMVNKAYFVGILELFQESMCVLKHKTGHEIGEECNCENREEWDKAFGKMKISRHGVTARTPYLSEFNEETQKHAERLTQNDRVLYDQARQRLMKEVHEVEQKVGKKIMCQKAASNLHSTHETEIDVDYLDAEGFSPEFARVGGAAVGGFHGCSGDTDNGNDKNW